MPRPTPTLVPPLAQVPSPIPPLAPIRARGRFAARWTTIALGMAGLACVTLAVGCVEIVAWAMVRAPNQHLRMENLPATSELLLAANGVDREMRVAVGPPTASLSVWIIEPKGAAKDAARAELRNAATADSKNVVANEPRGPNEPRGTVLVLHGIMARKDWMLGVGRKLAENGYRAVLVDLRGHGKSSGDWITYGVVETRDLQQVLDALDREELLAGPVGVYGASFGAACAIQLAGADSRVRAVVAVAPFQSLDAVLPPAAREFVPFGESLISDEILTKAKRRAANLADFDPSQADTLAAIRKTHARILIIHGRDDGKIPVSQSEKLAEAGPSGTRLLVLDREGHYSIMMDGSGVLMRETVGWFGAAGAEGSRGQGAE
ncbi:MAG: alpha/beta hydrolase [Phycisphaerae bacterium]